MGIAAFGLDLERPLLWTVENLLSPEECAAHVERIGAALRDVATVGALTGQQTTQNSVSERRT